MIRLKKETRELHVFLTKNLGATFEGHTGSGHLRYRLTNGRILFAASTPSDHRASINTRRRAVRLSALPPQKGSQP